MGSTALSVVGAQNRENKTIANESVPKIIIHAQNLFFKLQSALW